MADRMPPAHRRNTSPQISRSWVGIRRAAATDRRRTRVARTHRSVRDLDEALAEEFPIGLQRVWKRRR